MSGLGYSPYSRRPHVRDVGPRAVEMSGTLILKVGSESGNRSHPKGQNNLGLGMARPPGFEPGTDRTMINNEIA